MVYEIRLVCAQDSAGGEMTISILFLAANPTEEAHLRLDTEYREIETNIQLAENRDQLSLTAKWAVRPKDLQHYLNRVKPNIVHFSGHGTQQSIILVDDDNKASAISSKALVALFGAHKRNIRIIFLNGCYSESQATALTNIVDCAIGMSNAISDNAAVKFAAAFYGALAYGESVQNAFNQGNVELLLAGIPENETPKLLARQGVDLDDLTLTTILPKA